jgi:hypothetical protein
MAASMPARGSAAIDLQVARDGFDVLKPRAILGRPGKALKEMHWGILAPEMGALVLVVGQDGRVAILAVARIDRHGDTWHVLS